MNPNNSDETGSFLQSIFTKNPKIETLIADLLTLFGQSKIQTCEFLFQCLSNDLFSDSTAAALTVAFLKTTHELGFFQFIHGLGTLYSQLRPSAAHKAFLAFQKDPKMTEFMTLDVAGLEKKLTALFPEIQAPNIGQQVVRGLSQFPRIGPKPSIPPIYAFRKDSEHRLIFDDWPSLNLILEEIRSLAAADAQAWQPSFLLPIPVELPISHEEFCTPFPFMVEAPLLNTVLPFPEIITEMIRDCAELTDDATKGGL